MARNVISKLGEFSGAHVISLQRVDARPKMKKNNYIMPEIGDVIVYNNKIPFCDCRTTLRKEMRGCMKVTGIYRYIVTGLSYQFLQGQQEPISYGISLQVNDFKVGNIVYVKMKEAVCNNLYSYEDWMLNNNQNMNIVVENLHPSIKEKVIEDVIITKKFFYSSYAKNILEGN